MPLAVVLKLRALSAGHLTEGSGPAVHGFWLRRWAQVAPAVFEQLHADGTPPFSLSPLMGLPQAAGAPIKAGQAVWVRLCLLRDDLWEPLEIAWLKDLAQVSIAGQEWALEAASRTPAEHAWADRVEYRKLIAAHLERQHPPDRWRLEFAAPYATKSGNDRYLPVPLPDSLLRSWLTRWSAIAKAPGAEPWQAAVQADKGFLARVRESLVIGAFDLHTERPLIGERGMVGCVGRLELRSLDLSTEDLRLIDLLAHFAFYAGSGYKTTQGMGLTRLSS
jgi:CRISPR-associated endoribonuclease Cas6